MVNLNPRSYAFSALAAAAAICAGVPSAHATIVSYSVFLTGSAESPVNASPGFGVGTADYNDVAHTLHLHVDFLDLIGTTTASHIHAATASPFAGTSGVATTLPSFTGFPLGVTSGTFDSILDLTLSSSYNSSYITANGGTTASAEAALTTSFAQGRAYWNIHTTAFPGGEIRGFLPAPASAALLGLGGLAVGRRRR